MANSKKYWKGLEHLEETAQFKELNNNEFPEHLPADKFLGDKEALEDSSTTRRDFLKYLGFGVAAASLAACETPVTKAIPYINKPEEITPGVANYYASSYFDGNDYAPILVKTREGRPIFIKGNTSSSLTKGELNARVNSSVLSLYDGNRLKAPMIGGAESTWASVDNRLGKELEAIKAKGGNVKVLSNTLISPSTKEVIAKFTSQFNVAESEEVSNDKANVYFDAISYSGILNANQKSFSKRVLPTYNFQFAKTIVAVGADFLSGWLDAIQYNVGYAETRKPENDWMSKHFQFEANMSLTGTNADVRVPIKPSEYGLLIASIYNQIATKLGKAKVKSGKLDEKYGANVKKVVEHLLANKGESIVVCGVNDENIQVLVNELNWMLGNYEKTININKPSFSKQADDKEVKDLIAEMNEGKVDALFIMGVDPVFVFGDAFKTALGKVKTTVSFASKLNDTAAACQYVCPDNHFLESWNDVNPVEGHYSLVQPTISPLFDTRQAQDSFIKWSGNNTKYHDFIQKYWETNLFSKQTKSLLFIEFWNTSLHDGVFDANESIDKEEASFSSNLSSLSVKNTGGVSEGLELTLYVKEGIGDGAGADNPMLQELPDPVSKIVWDNYITMNPSEMKEKGYNTHFGQREEMQVLEITANGNSIVLPVIAQPGQARGTIGVALGYGKKVGKMETVTGVNAYPLVDISKTIVSYTTIATIKEQETDEPRFIACTQGHSTIMGRDAIIRETTIDVYKKGNKADYNPAHTLLAHENGESVNKITKEFNLWGKDQPVEDIGHRWGMSIDMNLCTGCGACITACNIENNVAIIGQDEMRRGRSMHWLRIDRYYSSEYQDAGDIAGTLAKTKEATGKGTTFSYQEMETPEDNPMVVHQPMMCQHCNHAGCETVCPVAATTHSNEGLNMMTYNRCIGTRYCANNCAYKVRRFNWYNYTAYKKFTDFNPSQDDLGRMVLNPDVVVRTRGVMEKCSMCIQGIQAAKLEAKKEGRPVRDGEVDCACAGACGSSAITFGDLNDKKSQVRAGMENDRAYRVIEEKGQEPNIYYQTKVRNLTSKEA